MPKEATDALEGWASARSAREVYVRTMRQTTSRVQTLVAKFARDALEAKNVDEEFVDILGEKDVLDKLKVFLDKNGVVDHSFDHLSTFEWPDADAAADLINK